MQCVCVCVYMLSAYMLVLKSQKWVRSSRKAACRKGQRVQRAEQRRILRCRGSWKRKISWGQRELIEKKKNQERKFSRRQRQAALINCCRAMRRKMTLKVIKIFKILALKKILNLLIMEVMDDLRSSVE